jgi:DNA relaxase NicK
MELSKTPIGSISTVIDWARSRARSHGAGDWVKPWAWQGYIGNSIGPVAVGERLDGSIVRVTSKAAHDWFKSGLPIGHNVSRFDIALTVFGVSDIDGLIARHKDETLEHRKGLRLGKYGVRQIDSYGDGNTLYIGSRSSLDYVRIYNKEKEQRNNADYKTAIRYEVEFHNEHATEGAQRIVANGYSVASCWAILASVLTRRGVVPVVGLGAPGNFQFHNPVPKQDIQRSLSWLRDQVSPTVRKLLREGLYDEVFEALGIGVIDQWRGE